MFELSTIFRYSTNFLKILDIGGKKERFHDLQGVKHFHLSNGNIKGIQRNPSHDSNGLFAGLIMVLKRSNNHQS